MIQNLLVNLRPTHTEIPTDARARMVNQLHEWKTRDS